VVVQTYDTDTQSEEVNANQVIANPLEVKLKENESV